MEVFRFPRGLGKPPPEGAREACAAIGTVMVPHPRQKPRMVRAQPLDGCGTTPPKPPALLRRKPIEARAQYHSALKREGRST